ncbi:MAG: hypothetical protein H0V19_10205, partial [Euzebyales bacterium]|nr:hypothetical protein [Euzebyales bacterium]
MDSDALRISDLVVQACEPIERVEAGRPVDDDAWSLLQHLRAELCALAQHSGDGAACSAACDTVA